MGGGQTREEAAMVAVLQPGQFAPVESRGEGQVWEDLVSGRRYLVVAVEEAELTEHNLQLFHFRKLNRAYLAGVHALAKEERSLCARPATTLLMLDYLPFSLGDFGRSLAVEEGLTVLQAALAGYRIMSYLFGPLATSPDMIRFTEAGVPKVWANERLHCNYPSHAANADSNADLDSRWPTPRLTVAEKKISSIRSILQTVSSALAQPFSGEFVREMEGARSYEEAEEAVERFCRREQIELEEWIQVQSQEQPMVLAPRSSRSSSVRSLPYSHQPVQRSSFAPVQPTNHYPTQVAPGIDFAPNYPVVFQSNFRPNAESQTVISQSRSQAVPFPPLNYAPAAPPQPVQVRAMVHPQPVVTETIITTFPFDSQRTHFELKAPPLLKTAKVSADDRVPVNEPPPAAEDPFEKAESHVEQVSPQQGRVQSSLPTRQELQSSVVSQSSHEPDAEANEDYQLVVHEITDNSLSHGEAVAMDKTIEMEEALSAHVSTPPVEQQQDGWRERAEIDLWEESMQKVTRKMASQQSSEYYRSEERDQVLMPGTPSPPPEEIADKTEEELERYIRSKYSDYFAEKELTKAPSHHHTNSLDKQLFEKRVAFVPDLPEQDEEALETGKFVTKPTIDTNRYNTFGNIDPEPPTASFPNQTKPSLDAGRRVRRPNDDSINARYSKYVVNRPGRATRQVSSQFADRSEGAGTYDDLRRLLHS